MVAMAATAAFLIAAGPVLAQARLSTQLPVRTSDATLAQEQAEIDRINAARQQADAEYARQQAACYQKFAVNNCLSEARDHRRVVVADLKRQEVALNDVKRKRAAADQVLRLEERQSELRAAEAESKRQQALSDQRAREERSVTKAGDRQAVVNAAPTRQEEQRKREAASVEKAAAAAQRAANAPGERTRYEARVKDAEDQRKRQQERVERSNKPGVVVKPLPVPQ